MFSLQKSLPLGRLFCIGIQLLKLIIVLLLGDFAAQESLHAENPDEHSAVALAAPTPVLFSLGNFLFTRPPTWNWVIPSSAMRKVQLTIPSSGNGASESADVSFFSFGKDQGGSVQANIERWAKQFTAPDGTPAKAVTESRTIAGTSVTFVSAQGSFTAGMMDGSQTTKSDFALQGAILEDSHGDFGNLFIKMTGPEKTVKEAAPIFDSMIEAACQSAAGK